MDLSLRPERLRELRDVSGTLIDLERRDPS
jgi:hypothetical protein